MTEFFQKRLEVYQKKLFRYLKYVFNDHLSLLLLFVLGGFVYYYTEILKQVANQKLLVKLIVVGIWLTSLSIGKLATLLQEADKVFLIPKENALRGYLKKAYQHSIFLPIVTTVLSVGLAFPLLLVVTDIKLIESAVFLILLGILKLADLRLQQFSLYQLDKEILKKWRGIWVVLSVVSLVIGVFIHSLAGLIVTVIGSFLLYKYSHSLERKALFDWDKAVSLEKKRQKKIYQFINLFTDVPGITSSVKRRAWLDPLLNKITRKFSNTYFYLFAHRFIRGTEFSGLYVRLLTIAILMILFTKEVYFVLPIALIALFLIGFQLLPLYQQFDYMVLTSLYPIDSKQKRSSLQKLISYLLLIAILLLMLSILISLTIGMSLLVLIMLMAFVFLFVYLYIPKRLKKMDR